MARKADSSIGFVFAGGRILYATEKGLDSRQIHGDHLVGHVSVGLGMDSVGCLLVRCIDKTECRPAFGIVPARQELHAVLILDFQVLDVQLGNFLGGKFDHVVTIQEIGIRCLPIGLARS